MKNFSWFKKIGIVAVALSAMIFVMAGCDQNVEPPHEHTFSEKWTSDSTHHWHAATCEHTTEISGKAEHDFTKTIENGKQTCKCSVCGYVSWTGPVLKKGTDFTSALTENLGVKTGSSANVTKVVFALLSEDGIKEKVKALEENKTNIGKVDDTCYAYAESEGDNLIICIVPADENATGFAFNEDCSKMFYEFKKCEKIEGLSLADTSNVTDMSSMFEICFALTSLDLSNFNTSNVTNMSSMFDTCYNLKTLDVSKFDTSKVTNMYAMFYYCTTLTTLDVSNFNTSNVTSMRSMFRYCQFLKTLDVRNFDTSNVTEMKSMFSRCVELKSLDLSNFDTSKVTDMSNMFQYSSSLKSLDLSSFDTSKVTTMQEMFESTNLEEIIVADKSTFVPEGCDVTDMFKDAVITSTDGLTNKSE